MATRFAALLRAVNVGGRSSLKMSDLRAVTEDLGFGQVQTLLQSGNLVFAAKGTTAALESALEAALKKHTGMATDFVVRSAKQLDAIISANPFPAEATSDPGHLVVMFLKGRVGAKDVVTLQGRVKGRELIRAGEHALYITYPDGIGRSRLTGSVIEKILGTRGTARNWNRRGPGGER